MRRFRRSRFAIGLALVSMSGLSIAAAQDASTTILEQSVAILNSVQTTTIMVVVIITLLVLIGGLVMFMRVRQLDQIARDQRTKLAEMQALYRELQGARKRTENALSMITGKSEELTNTRIEVDAVLRAALARMTQAVALLPVGESQYRAQDYSGALATYLRAAELDESNPLAHYRAGYTAIQVNQLERAMNYLHRTLDIDSEFAPALAAMGYLHRRLAEAPDIDDQSRVRLTDEAERYLSEALNRSRRLLDEDGEAWMAALAGVYRRRRLYDRAIAIYTEATEITPFSSYPYACIALLHADKADYPQMFKNYERVEWRARNETSARPANPWGHANLLLARLALGREDKLVEEEFTLTFLSLPRETTFIPGSLMGSLRRLEWALASAGQPARAERVAFFIRRMEHFQSTLAAGTARQTGSHRAALQAANRASTGSGDGIRTSSEMPMPREFGTTKGGSWADLDFDFD